MPNQKRPRPGSQRGRKASQQSKKIAAKQTPVMATLSRTKDQFRILAEAAKFAIFVIQGEKARYVNPASQAMTGYTEKELLAMDFWEFIHPDSRGLVRERGLARQRGETIPSEYEFKIITKDGEERWVALATATTEFDGKPAILGVGHDITELKRTQDKLRKSEEILRLLFDGVRDYAIIMLDAEGRIVSWNAGAERIKGYRAEEIIGRHFCRLYEKQAVEQGKCEQALKEAALAGRFEEEGWRVRKDGSRFRAHVIITPLRDVAGALRGFAKVTRDISEKKQTEEALLRSEEKYRLIIDHINEVVYSVAIQGDDLMHGTLEFMSSKVEDVTGYRPEEFVANPSLWFDSIHPEDVPEVIESTTRMFATKKGGTRLYRLRHKKTGEYRWNEDRIVPRLDEKGNVTGFFGVARDVTERKQVEEDLRASEKAFRESQRVLSTLMSNLPGMAYRCRNDRNWTMEFVSGGCSRLTGYDPSELIGNSRVSYARLIHPAHQASVWEEVQKAVKERRPFELIYRIHTAAKETKWVWEKGQGVFSEEGELIALEGFITDITETKRAEDRVRQAQKMEAIGQLAGGIAHDVNNTLGAIQGWTELALEDAAENDPLHGRLERIRKLATNSTNLVRQLLAFARRQPGEPRKINLNQTVTTVLGLLEKLIGADIEARTSLAADAATVQIDPTHVEQIMTNLCLNARDAMPKGGCLLIETKNAYVDEEFCRKYVYARPGSYVVLSVSDTGVGMDRATQDRIFEPFFTTKEVGKGTGLGLAVVYGIVKQNGGFINVYSEPGQGSTFRVYFPPSEGVAERPEEEVAESARGGPETILVAEDNDEYRETVRETLEKLGYEVLLADNGEEAVSTFEAHRDRIALVLLDVVMPKMGGPEAYAKMEALKPGVPVIFATGYSPEAVPISSTSGTKPFVLQKPYSPKILRLKVRELLDRVNAKLM